MKTKIQWTQATVNFWWGCDKVSPACKNCYAENIANRFGEKLFGHAVHWGKDQPRGQRTIEAFAELAALNKQAIKQGEPIMVFINSMSDWLDDQVPAQWLSDLLYGLAKNKMLRPQLLTKRPENFRKRMEAVAALDDVGSQIAAAYLRGETALPHAWIGVTAEDQPHADKRIPELLKIPANIRFLSCEPLLGEITLPLEYEICRRTGLKSYPFSLPEKHRTKTLHDIHWIIAGGESGSNSRPTRPDWIRSLRDQAEATSIPFFFKQWGSYCPAESITQAQLKSAKQHTLDDGTTLYRAGTKASGNILDNQEHNAFPLITAH